MSTILSSLEPANTPANSDPHPTAPAPAAPRRRSGLNAGQQRELTKAREVLAAARESAHQTGLARRDVTDVQLDALNKAITTADDTGAATEGARPKRAVATRLEQAARRDLIACLREIQACARRRYRIDSPEKLAAFKVGEDLNQARPVVEGLANSILAQARADGLPGLPAESLARAKTCLDAFLKAQVDQTGAGGEAESLTDERNRLVQAVKNLRIDLQLAVEAEWPSSLPTNAAVRRKFKLPPYQPFTP